MPTTSIHNPVVVRELGRRHYAPVLAAMQSFSGTRDTHTRDEIWLVEHEPVYTLGLNCKSPRLSGAGDIPRVQTDRGGQMTYHGPGQTVVYVMADLRRRGLGVKALVTAMEQAVIDLLAEYDVPAIRRKDAPGVYVDGAKIAALGLRVKQGRSYHGISLNVDMDLAPFDRIDPCGYPGLRSTQLKDLGISLDVFAAGRLAATHLQAALGYNDIEFSYETPIDPAHA